mmetsp:Transcript_16617/g.29107  ORF Transcript_16617/g.29107 Transcript_16617/m.29107 type:complete len:144 (-) Transcript_16617:434-865(-)
MSRKKMQSKSLLSEKAQPKQIPTGNAKYATRIFCHETSCLLMSSRQSMPLSRLEFNAFPLLGVGLLNYECTHIIRDVVWSLYSRVSIIVFSNLAMRNPLEAERAVLERLNGLINGTVQGTKQKRQLREILRLEHVKVEAFVDV